MTVSLTAAAVVARLAALEASAKGVAVIAGDDGPATFLGMTVVGNEDEDDIVATLRLPNGRPIDKDPAFVRSDSPAVEACLVAHQAVAYVAGRRGLLTFELLSDRGEGHEPANLAGLEVLPSTWQELRDFFPRIDALVPIEPEPEPEGMTP